MTERVSGPILTTRRAAAADVLVVGDGIIGLSSALAVARGGGTSCVVGYRAPGSASPASAGLLAPSIGEPDAVVRQTMIAARDRYPEFLAWLAERTGIDVPLNRRGIIEVARSASEAEALARAPMESATLLEPGVLRSLEPALAPVRSAVLHANDGFVDNVRLLEAMREAVRCEWAVDDLEGRAARVEREQGTWRLHMEDGRRYEAATLVVAAGAWSPLVVGVPRPLHVEPVRGQMVKLRGALLQHAIASHDAYVVPRGDYTLVGSTLERVGFNFSTTKSAIERLRAAATALVPQLANVPVVDSWAGLRPMTPDGWPIIGRDPAVPSVVYACGHGKNGILLAPLTGECVAAIAAGSEPSVDLRPFGVERFD